MQKHVMELLERLSTVQRLPCNKTKAEGIALQHGWCRLSLDGTTIAITPKGYHAMLDQREKDHVKKDH